MNIYMNDVEPGVAVYKDTHEPPDSGPTTYYWCCARDGACSTHKLSYEAALVEAAEHVADFHRGEYK